MLQSALFPRTLKNPPRDESSVNARLLAQAGFMEKTMAGVYVYLPLGLRVFKKIENIIRAEMVKAGGAEILMPSLHPRENWEKTGRWQTLDILFKVSTDEVGGAFALGPTHEEIVTPLVGRAGLSYRDLPLKLFQFQNKFRNEKRAKSGLLRGREFIMKDLYSFHADEAEAEAFYEEMQARYRAIFEVCGLGEKTYLTYASGGSFSKFSHEFQTLADAGEDVIFLCPACKVAVNSEIREEHLVCPQCGGGTMEEKKAIEVGNIFNLKTKFSSAFGAKYRREDGGEELLVMGCYGIGLGRLMGTIVETHHDDRGIVWPSTVAPFRVHLLALETSPEIMDVARDLYRALNRAEVETLFDDRLRESPGEKFADADLLGFPYRVVVSARAMKGGGYELKLRDETAVRTVSLNQLLEYVRQT